MIIPYYQRQQQNLRNELSLDPRGNNYWNDSRGKNSSSYLL